MRSLQVMSLLLAAVSHVQAGFNANSKSNLALYWGQNSAGQQSTQSRLSTYCTANVDIILMAFLLRFSGTGGQPVLNFANQGDKCTTFTGTELFNCPEIAADITACQAQGKTIMLSIGGDSYTEGGFSSTQAAIDAANNIWAMFGPVQSGSSALRPFNTSVIDGFDFDFEAGVTNMAAFANQLRTLMNANTSKKFYLSAAPQCPYPDAYDKDLTDNASLDFLNVQYYNNGCGASSFVPGATTQWNFNFDQWDTWAHTVSKNSAVKVLLGVPGNTGAGSGYVTPANLQPVIDYSANYSSFGGVMVWDASQAWLNTGFIDSVKSYLNTKKKRSMRWGARMLGME